MGRLISALIFVGLLVGCAHDPKIVYKYVSKPVLVCPSPQELNGGNPIPEITDLEIYKLTPDSTPGEVARAYEITIKQLQGQVQVLRELVDSYDHTSKEYEKLKGVLDTLYPDGAIAN